MHGEQHNAGSLNRPDPPPPTRTAALSCRSRGPQFDCAARTSPLPASSFQRGHVVNGGGGRGVAGAFRDFFFCFRSSSRLAVGCVFALVFLWRLRKENRGFADSRPLWFAYWEPRSPSAWLSPRHFSPSRVSFMRAFFASRCGFVGGRRLALCDVATWPRGQGAWHQARRLSEDEGGVHHSRPFLPPALNRAKAQHACVLRPPERGGASCQFLIKTPMTSTPPSTCLG